ncbi:hypothetical protein NC652_002322 [Populus alba x Populus x berolinensis]|nr:hypothetical protein NC652_002322 [Populus alba x Populus x berolinensis]
MVQASHPDIVSDFIFHEISTPDADLYTFTGIPASMVEFHFLQFLNFLHFLQFPHRHPRSTELPFLLHGSLEVGFIDTTNKLYTLRLQTGHFLYNVAFKNPAIVISLCSAVPMPEPTQFLLLSLPLELKMLSSPMPAKLIWILSKRSRQPLHPRLKLKFSSSPPSVEITLLSAFSSFLILARQDYDINYLAE